MSQEQGAQEQAIHFPEEEEGEGPVFCGLWAVRHVAATSCIAASAVPVPCPPQLRFPLPPLPGVPSPPAVLAFLCFPFTRTPHLS